MTDKCYRCGSPVDTVALPTVTETDEQQGETITRVYCNPQCFAHEHGYRYPTRRHDYGVEPVVPFWDSGIRCNTTADGASVDWDFNTDWTYKVTD